MKDPREVSVIQCALRERLACFGHAALGASDAMSRASLPDRSVVWSIDVNVTECTEVILAEFQGSVALANVVRLGLL